jgi:hypothetical protein
MSAKTRMTKKTKIKGTALLPQFGLKRVALIGDQK